MVFISICTAIYDYTPQGENELAIKEGELLYIIEKSAEEDWWRAKKKASGDDEDEPIGLIPNNYVEEVSILKIRLPFVLWIYSPTVYDMMSCSPSSSVQN